MHENIFTDANHADQIVCEKCRATIVTPEGIKVDFKTRKKVRKIPGGGSISLIILGLLFFISTIINWKKADLEIAIPLALVLMGSGLFLMYRHYKRKTSLLFNAICPECGHKTRKWAQKSPVPDCPKCAETWVYRQEILINTKDGKIIKSTQFTGGLFSILLGLVALFAFIAVQLAPEVKGMGLYYLALGAFLIWGGITSIRAYKKIKKTILSKYECSACHHKWKNPST